MPILPDCGEAQKEDKELTIDVDYDDYEIKMAGFSLFLSLCSLLVKKNDETTNLE